MPKKGNGTGYWDGEFVIAPAISALHDAKAATNPYEGNPLDLTIFVSCYNEARLIVATLEALCTALKRAKDGKLTYEIIVVDDCSTDRSASIVSRFISERPEEPVMLRINRRNKGWAENYLDAATLGRGKYYRAICGDNTEPVETLLTVFNCIGDADIIVPYYTEVRGRGAKRKFISGLYTDILNLITGHRLKYYNGLPVHLRHNVIRWHSNTRGAGFQADILCMLLDQGFSYKEVGVLGVENRPGNSSVLTFKNGLSVTHTLVEIVLRRISSWVYGR